MNRTSEPDLFTETTEDLLAARERQVSKLQGQINTMGAERRQWEKDIRAAALRQAWHDVTYNVGLHVKPRVVREASTLLYELSVLTEKPNAIDVHRVRSAAASLKEWLAGLDVEPEGSYVAELKRLRAALTEQGQKLHAEHGQSTGERCGCPGCELIRAAYSDPASITDQPITEGAPTA